MIKCRSARRGRYASPGRPDGPWPWLPSKVDGIFPWSGRTGLVRTGMLLVRYIDCDVSMAEIPGHTKIAGRRMNELYLQFNDL